MSQMISKREVQINFRITFWKNMKIHPWAGALRKAVLKGDIPWPFVRKPLGF